MSGAHRMRRRAAKLTDQDAAFAAAQWCSGILQREIAGHFGYNNSAAISVAIRAFIERYKPDYPTRPSWYYVGGKRVDREIMVQDEETRKALAKEALANFLKAREAAWTHLNQ